MVAWGRMGPMHYACCRWPSVVSPEAGRRRTAVNGRFWAVWTAVWTPEATGGLGLDAARSTGFYDFRRDAILSSRYLGLRHDVKLVSMHQSLTCVVSTNPLANERSFLVSASLMFRVRLKISVNQKPCRLIFEKTFREYFLHKISEVRKMFICSAKTKCQKQKGSKAVHFLTEIDRPLRNRFLTASGSQHYFLIMSSISEVTIPC